MNPEVRTIVIEIEIGARVDRVWDALANKLPEWWPKDFVALPGAMMHFEPRAGGRLWEVAPEGGGESLWGTVVLIKPGSTLELVGHSTQSFGGPALNMVCMSLKDEGVKTRFRLSNAIFGCVDDAQEANLREGWGYLLNSGLKAFCES